MFPSLAAHERFWLTRELVELAHWGISAEALIQSGSCALEEAEVPWGVFAVDPVLVALQGSLQRVVAEGAGGVELSVAGHVPERHGNGVFRRRIRQGSSQCLVQTQVCIFLVQRVCHLLMT